MEDLLPNISNDRTDTTGSPTGTSLETRRPIADLIWSVLPSALQRSMSNGDKVWVSPQNQSFFGITIENESRHDDTSDSDDHSTFEVERLRLTAWAGVCSADSNEDFAKRPLFELVESRRSRAMESNGIEKRNGNSNGRNRSGPTLPPKTAARFHVLNGRPDRVSIDVVDHYGQFVCRLTCVLVEGRRPLIWADSILPNLLELPGGRYELDRVDIPGLTSL